jgi:hypothetical protein
MQQQVAPLVERVLRQNCSLNLWLRVGLAVFGMSAGVLALVYTVVHGHEIVAAVDGDGDLLAVVAESVPALLYVLLGTLAGLVAWAVHARGVEEMYGTLDILSRMERQHEVAVSARGLIYAFEEKLQNTRRAFTLLLWLGRTLFIVCLGLFAAAIVSAMIEGVSTTTVVLGASSIAGALLGVARDVPRNIAHHLADVIQIQSIVTGCDRQISLLESLAFNAMNANTSSAATHRRGLEVQERMGQVVAAAVDHIETFADRPSG